MSLVFMNRFKGGWCRNTRGFDMEDCRYGLRFVLFLSLRVLRLSRFYSSQCSVLHCSFLTSCYLTWDMESLRKIHSTAIAH